MNLRANRAFRAILTVVALALSMTSQATAKVPVSETARELFAAGLAMANDGNCKDGYQKFRAAYEDSPSPNILGNLGYCAMQLERDGEAIEAYERYLREGEGVSNKERAAIVQDLVKLKGQVATIRLILSPLQCVVTDERLDAAKPISNEYAVVDGRLNVGVHPGRHRLTIRSAGRREFVWEVDATKGTIQERSVTLELVTAAPTPAPTEPVVGPPVAPVDPKPPVRPVEGKGLGAPVVVGMVATGVLAAATVVLGVVALDNKTVFDEALVAGDLNEARELKETGETLNIITDVALGTTVAVAAVTAVLWAMDGDDADPEESAVTVLPVVLPASDGLTSGAVVGVFGRF